jgi:hypothetical protein
MGPTYGPAQHAPCGPQVNFHVSNRILFDGLISKDHATVGLVSAVQHTHNRACWIFADLVKAYKE